VNNAESHERDEDQKRVEHDLIGSDQKIQFR